MAPLRLRAVHPTSGEPSFIDVPQSGTVHVRAIPGATGVHVALERDGRVALRAEVECSPEDTIRLEIEADPDGSLAVSSLGRDVFTLPPTAPEPRIARTFLESKALDIVFVVDATARLCQLDKSTNQSKLATPLLATPEEWKRHVSELVELQKALAARHGDVRYAVIAFGDTPLPHVSARDLTANRYKLWPEERVFRPCTASDLTQALAAVPPSPGGDYVDALADALEACVSLHFRDQARKLVILTGESPGYSLVRPPPPTLQLDAHVRDLDVDSAAQRLFNKWGAEVATIFHGIPGETGFLDLADRRDAVAFARAQYARLATRPSLGVRRSGFAPAGMAESLLTTKAFFGMGASLPVAADS